MQIRIRNFGPIKSFDFDLKKDFTVIFGKNNIGKSYSISICYIILKNLLEYKKILSLSSETENKTVDGIGLTHGIQESFHATFEGFERFENITNRLSGKETSIVIQTDVAESIILKGTKISARIFIDPSELGIDFVHYLPASRSGLYQALSAFSQIFAELSKSRGFLKKKVGIPSIPEPVSDYFLGLSNIRTRKTGGDSEIIRIVEDLERNILKGEILFDEETRKIFYRPSQTDLYLDVSLTSSMVSELSPIVSYLKYVVAFEDAPALIFIEEPEAHLHPQAQVRLMEIFAKLLQQNVKIIMTSHSNYMFNKMNNLILDKKIDTDTAGAVVFDETDEGSIGKYIPMDELGIEDENFLDVAEKLFNEKLELVEKLNKYS